MIVTPPKNTTGEINRNSVRYFLRAIDFRPEELTEDKLSFLGFGSMKKAIEQLTKSSNLFDTESDAIKASMAVRSKLFVLRFLRQERQEYNRRKKKPSDNNAEPSLKVRRSQIQT